jgi:hypothetical protein
MDNVQKRYICIKSDNYLQLNENFHIVLNYQFFLSGIRIKFSGKYRKSTTSM